jgi:hypothetical protein
LQRAPVTVAHILKLAKLGGFNSCNFFRVDKGVRVLPWKTLDPNPCTMMVYMATRTAHRIRVVVSVRALHNFLTLIFFVLIMLQRALLARLQLLLHTPVSGFVAQVADVSDYNRVVKLNDQQKVGSSKTNIFFVCCRVCTC